MQVYTFRVKKQKQNNKKVPTLWLKTNFIFKQVFIGV